MIDYGTTANLVTSTGSYNLGKIRSANFTVMAVGKNIEIIIIDEPVEKTVAAALIMAVDEQGTTLSLINSSSQDDYTVVLVAVNYSSSGLSVNARLT